MFRLKELLVLRSKKLLAIRRTASADKSETQSHRQDEIGVQKRRKQNKVTQMMICVLWRTVVSKSET